MLASLLQLEDTMLIYASELISSLRRNPEIQAPHPTFLNTENLHTLSLVKFKCILALLKINKEYQKVTLMASLFTNLITLML
jgi:hypothetical protein